MTMQLVQAMDNVTGMMAPKDDPSEVKEYLREVRHIHLRTEVLCARAEKYREMASRATGRMDAVRVSGTPDRSKVEQYVLELVDMHDELQKEIKRLVRYTQKAEKLIQQLPDERYRAVLQLRYLCGYDWQEIADRLHFSLRWVHKLHGEALAELTQRRTL